MSNHEYRILKYKEIAWILSPDDDLSEPDAEGPDRVKSYRVERE